MKFEKYKIFPTEKYSTVVCIFNNYRNFLCLQKRYIKRDYYINLSINVGKDIFVYFL